MAFAVNSTSTITAPCKHFALDTMQRAWVSRILHKIQFAGVFNCRRIAGSSSWSQHAFGNAVDLFCAESDQWRIAVACVRQAMRKTFANRGKLAPIHYVIIAGKVWTKERGWHEYTGFHPPTHVHVDFFPEQMGAPPCA